MVPEGASLDLCFPDQKAQFHLKGTTRSWRVGGRRRLLTYVARNLEPYRGIHTLLRALPRLLKAAPNLDVVIVGGEGVSYGAAAEQGSWKDYFLALLPEQLDTNRVFFPGQIEYSDYLNLLKVSAAHVYLTYPFVASWSLREAMAVGCAIVGSDTAPVREFITDGENGLLVPFLEPDALTDAVLRLLNDKALSTRLRAAARAYAVANLDSAQHIAAMDALVRETVGEQP